MKKLTCNIASTFALGWIPVIASAAAPASSATTNAAGANGGGIVYAFALPVLAVVIAMLALWWLVRRYAVARGGSGPMRVTQALAVGPRERVVLVEAGGKRLVVGVTPAAVTLLTQLDQADVAGGSMSAPPTKKPERKPE